MPIGRATGAMLGLKAVGYMFRKDWMDSGAEGYQVHMGVGLGARMWTMP